jgi:hypothetical protein
MSDYSFMASWDRADREMVSKWWDIEPVSKICATLLDLKMEGECNASAFDFVFRIEIIRVTFQ